MGAESKRRETETIKDWKLRVESEAKAKIKKVIESARLHENDSRAVGLRKLKKAMANAYGKNFDAKTEPLGVTLSEKIQAQVSMDWTASGGASCTFPPWSCHFDPDF